MELITLDELKDQLRIERDYHDEDAHITACGNAAEAALLSACRRTVDDLLANFGTTDATTGDTLPPPDFKMAILMLGKHVYDHRDPTDSMQQVQVPFSIDLMVKPFIKLSGTE